MRVRSDEEGRSPRRATGPEAARAAWRDANGSICHRSTCILYSRRPFERSLFRAVVFLRGSCPIFSGHTYSASMALSRRSISVALFLVAVATLSACTQQDVPRGQWFVGTISADHGTETVFGPAGPIAIEWQQPPGQGSWIWRDYRPNGWTRQIVWEQDGSHSFLAAVSTGAWEGRVDVLDSSGSGIFAPGGWSSLLILTDKTGTIVGKGETSGGDDSMDQSGDAVSSEIGGYFDDQQWVRADGSVAGHSKQSLRACSYSEFQAALRRFGAP